MSRSLDRLAVLLAGEGVPTFAEVSAVNLRLLDSCVAERRQAQAAGVPLGEWVASEEHMALKREMADLLARGGVRSPITTDAGRANVTEWCRQEEADGGPTPWLVVPGSPE